MDENESSSVKKDLVEENHFARVSEMVKNRIDDNSKNQ